MKTGMRKNIAFIILFVIFSCSEKKEPIIPDETAAEIESVRELPSGEKIFKWNTELCENEGSYDSNKYTASELTATYKLWWDSHGYLGIDVLPRNDEEFPMTTIEKLDQEYGQALQELQNLKVVNENYWLELKKNKIRELNERYELKKIAINASSRPQVLMENRFTEHCSEYAEALSSMDDELLIQKWTELVQEQMERNGSPDRVLAKFNQQNASNRRLIYARNQLLTYGWWNCANHIIYHFEDDGTPQKEFEKLFKNIKKECDEP